jgi:hypothetical protein
MGVGENAAIEPGRIERKAGVSLERFVAVALKEAAIEEEPRAPVREKMHRARHRSHGAEELHACAHGGLLSSQM